MLILSRRVDEKLLIGKDIVVTVTRIGKQNVRLGIEAPAHVNIVRAELEDDDGSGILDGGDEG